MSRRALLLLLLFTAACQAGDGLEAAQPGAAAATPWGELSVEHVTSMAADETGGTAIVFLHGYGATGSAYRPLAQAVMGPKTRVFLPTAALPHTSGTGAIWWEFGGEDWPRPYSDDPTANEWPEPSSQLPVARAAVANLIAAIRTRYEPDELAIAGHSQGGMLALDVGVSIEPPPDRVGILASYALLDSVPNIEQPREPRPSIFISHGRQDSVVSFDAGQRMESLLLRSGFDVEFVPHVGGHEISAGQVPALRAFLLP